MKAKTKRREMSIDMTSGSLWKNMLLFSLPLMLSYLLEILFNLSDVAIAGKFADYRALGSVGSTTQLVAFFTGFLIGIGNGVNVCTAHRLGAGDGLNVARTVHSSFFICIVVGVIIALASALGAEPLLALLHTKEELMEGAVMYLKIYALGMPAMAIYNCGSGILSAAGETKRPLVYLTISGILNVLLNLFFVIVCKKGAAGVAIASVISQYVSAILIIAHLVSRRDACRLRPTLRYIDGKTCRNILSLGIPSGFQNSIFSIANLFVQSGVNSFDAVLVSGNAAAANADTIVFNIMAAFYMGCASFEGRNLGAGQRERVFKSYTVALSYSVASGMLFGGLFFIFGRQFLSLFANEPEVISAGMERLSMMCWAFWICAIMDCSIAASRGIGKTLVPTIIVILGSCVFRVIWVYTVFAYFHTIASLYLLYSFSWAITAVAEAFYFLRSFKRLPKEPVLC